MRPDINRTLRARLAAAVLASALFPAVALASDKPVFIELYTSQGCSSCPPADKLLGEIAHKPGVIAVTLPVDYWDYIGWKDTFGKSGHTARQRAYAKIRGDGQVYTPQAVINGVAHVVGSDAAAIEKAREQNFGKSGALTVPLKVVKTDAGLSVEIGAGGPATPAQANIWLFRIKKQSEVFIGRGENKDRKLSYTNIGLSAARIGEWMGKELKVDIAQSVVDSPDSDGWIIVLQAGDSKMPGAVLAAAKSPGL